MQAFNDSSDGLFHPHPRAPAAGIVKACQSRRQMEGTFHKVHLGRMRLMRSRYLGSTKAFQPSQGQHCGRPFRLALCLSFDSSTLVKEVIEMSSRYRTRQCGNVPTTKRLKYIISLSLVLRLMCTQLVAVSTLNRYSSQSALYVSLDL